jgi:hypothetical protein
MRATPARSSIWAARAASSVGRCCGRFSYATGVASTRDVASLPMTARPITTSPRGPTTVGRIRTTAPVVVPVTTDPKAPNPPTTSTTPTPTTPANPRRPPATALRPPPPAPSRQPRRSETSAESTGNRRVLPKFRARQGGSAAGARHTDGSHARHHGPGDDRTPDQPPADEGGQGRPQAAGREALTPRTLAEPTLEREARQGFPRAKKGWRLRGQRQGQPMLPGSEERLELLGGC